MALAPLVGHQLVRTRLAEAVRGGRLPQVLLMTGAPGSGRQRVGLWLAQLLFCQARETEPCGRCRGCTLVLELGHPDLHWFIPIARPKAGDPDKQVEEAAESLNELIAERRRKPLWAAPDGMALHGVASARLLQRRAAMRPVEGGPAVYLIGDAERLVPQESSPEAANTLLKLLEEPGPDAVLILTAREPGSVLPTIRSRAVPLRLGRLDDQEVRAFLTAHGDASPDQVDDLVRVADGAIGRAIGDGAGEAGEKAATGAAALLDAVRRGPAEAYAIALRQVPYQARGEFTAMLDALLGFLADAARAASGLPPRRPLPPALRGPLRLQRLVAAVERVQDARQAAQGNVNPQLLLAGICAGLAEVL